MCTYLPHELPCVSAPISTQFPQERKKRAREHNVRDILSSVCVSVCEREIEIERERGIHFNFKKVLNLKRLKYPNDRAIS